MQKERERRGEREEREREREKEGQADREMDPTLVYHYDIDSLKLEPAYVIQIIPSLIQTIPRIKGISLCSEYRSACDT